MGREAGRGEEEDTRDAGEVEMKRADAIVGRRAGSKPVREEREGRVSRRYRGVKVVECTFADYCVHDVLRWGAMREVNKLSELERGEEVDS